MHFNIISAFDNLGTNFTPVLNHLCYFMCVHMSPYTTPIGATEFTQYAAVFLYCHVDAYMLHGVGFVIKVF